MVRTLLGMVTGTAVAALVIRAGQIAYFQLHPAQPVTDLTTLDSLSAHASAAPLQALACVLAGWAVAAFAGGWVGASVARYNRGAAALLVGALVTVAVLVHGAQVPNPEWVVVLGLLLPIPSAVLAKLLATPRGEF